MNIWKNNERWYSKQVAWIQLINFFNQKQKIKMFLGHIARYKPR